MGKENLRPRDKIITGYQDCTGAICPGDRVLRDTRKRIGLDQLTTGGLRRDGWFTQVINQEPCK